MCRVGILGGTFNPVHVGHVLLAVTLRERLPLDEVVLIPAADPPHKPARNDMASAEDRWRMVALAVNAVPGLSASRVELDRGGISYTVDTLDQLQVQHPDWDLHLLIGADNVAQIPRWHDPEGVLDRCTVVAGSRASGGELERVALDPRIVRVETPVFEVSSTEVRRRVRARLCIRYLVPETVECYIRAHALYV